MTEAALDIPNLLYRYADLFDAGKLADAAQLFDGGCVVADGHEIAGADNIEAMWRGFVHLYEDGTPRTRHLVTNPQISVDPANETAQCRSQWTVLQATENLPLQVIGSGRYADQFAKVDGAWRFTRREYAGIDFWGDTSAHLKQAPKES